jgi:hypothetical protein
MNDRKDLLSVNPYTGEPMYLEIQQMGMVAALRVSVESVDTMTMIKPPYRYVNVTDPVRGGNFTYFPEEAGLSPDNGIVFKAVSGGYWVRQKHTDHGFLEWYIGDDISDPVANLNAIVALSRAGYTIQLLKMYPIDTGGDRNYIMDNEDIEVFSENKEECGLIIERIHSNFGYFRGNKNYGFSHVTLVTRNYLNDVPVHPAMSNNYKLISIYDPSDNKIDFNNCNIFGQVVNRVRRKGSFTFFCKDNNFHHCTQFFSNAGENQFQHARIEFVNNSVKEMAGNMLFLSQMDKESLIHFTDNHFENGQVYKVTGAYFGPLVVTGDCTLYYLRNRIYNLLSSDMVSSGAPRATASLTTIAYTSVQHIFIHDNTAINVLGHNSAFIEFKNGRNFSIKRNVFKNHKQAIYDIGVLKKGEDYRNIKNPRSNFYYALCKLSKNHSFPNTTFEFTDNEIFIPYLNRGNGLPQTKIDFTRNKIEIDFHAGVSASDWAGRNLVYSVCQPASRYEGDQVIANHNLIKINDVAYKDEPAVFFSFEGQAAAKGNHPPRVKENVEISNNSFISQQPGLNFVLGSLNCRKVNCQHNEVLVSDSSIFISGTRLGADVAWDQVSKYDFKIKNANKLRLFYPRNQSNSEVLITDNHHDSIDIVNSWQNSVNWLFNKGGVNNPVCMEITVRAGGMESAFKLVLAQFNDLKYMNKNGEIVSVYLVGSGARQDHVFPCRGGQNPFSMRLYGYPKSNLCSIFIEGLGDFKQVEFYVNVIKERNVDVGTFYDKYLRIGVDG